MAKKWLVIGCLIYGLIFCTLVVGYFLYPRDQLIILGIVGLPLNLILFVLADLRSHGTIQVIALGPLGFVQYGAIGFLLGRLFSK